MQIRTYDKEKDGEAIKQMWIESGWGEYKDHERFRTADAGSVCGGFYTAVVGSPFGKATGLV